MRSNRVRGRVGGALAALSLVLCPHLATAGTDPGERALELLRTGDTTAALPLLRDHVAAHPDDAVMFYNLACAEAVTGDTAAAVAAVGACLAAGFEDLDRLRTDPDLAPLQSDAAFAAFLTEEESRLILLARERGADLAEGRRAGPLPLPVRGPAPPGDEPFAHLRWVPLGLEIEVAGGGVWTGLADTDAAAPWRGGPAVMVTLAVPGETRSYAAENAWLLACGRESKQPVGALHLPARGQWQPIAELDPRLDVDGNGRLAFRVTVPWRTIMPFHPLVDPELGLNIALRVPRADGAGFHVAELLPDPARFVPAIPRRRTALVTFDLGSIAAETFAGRVDDSINRGDLLPISLAAVVRKGGRGTVTVDFLDAAGHSVLPGGARGGNLELEVGVNRIERAADFSGLRMGSYQLRAEIGFPAGAGADWSTTILHLPPGWDDDLGARIASLPARDRPTAAHLLETVREALDRHVPRRHPGAIATTLGQLTTLLERGERTGSLLPETGAFTFVYPGPDGTRVVEGFLAAGAQRRDDFLPVVVLADAAGHEDRVLQRMLRFDTRQPAAPAADRPAPAFLVPRLPAATTDPVAEATAALAWARDYFGPGQALLVGVDGLADAALVAAARRPEAVAAVAVFAGVRVGLPNRPADLDGLRPGLPVTWFAFPLETAAAGDAIQLRDLLGERTAAAVEDREVRGGLDLSQVGDRTVLWARERATAD